MRMSLERILQAQGFGTRKACRIMSQQGEVTIDGKPCLDPAAEFDTENLQFAVRGEVWRYRQPSHLMLHKPAGFECSRQTRHHPTVYGLLPPPLVARGVQSIGRLDADATGLLLFTDDGQLIHRMTSPRWKVAKLYVVTTRHPISADQLRALQRGVLLHDAPAPVAAADCAKADDTTLHLTLTEGRYHQVKRMVAAAGNRVESLHRTRIGALTLPHDLAPGQWRWLDAADLAALHPAETTPATTPPTN